MIIHSNIQNSTILFEKDAAFTKEFININALIVVDKNVYNLYYDQIFRAYNSENIFIVEAIEEKKTIDTALEICRVMTKFPAKRNAVLIAFGGGIIQDVAGFAAGILYRGVRFILVPTTLLAQADSCIGGKTSLNFENYKNLLGSFYPPEKIYIYPGFVQTLSDLDFRSGLGEIIKFNVISGKDKIAELEQKMDLLLAKDETEIADFIYQSLLFKKTFVEEDEFDKGRRILLNFAHTFGHAIESVTKYEIPHGIAVAIGMMIANRISYDRKWLDEDTVVRIEKLCKRILKGVQIQNLHTEALINAVKNDKKRQSSGFAAVLLKSDYSLEVVQDVTQEEIESALTLIRSL